MATAQNVTISGADTPVTTANEPGTPTGFTDLTAGTNGQVKGTAGEDKATLATVLADKDHIFNMGAGDDVFVFRNNAEGLNGAINGIVDGGADNDRVFAAGQISDYVFSIRDDGGIKFHYTPDGDDGAAVTFRSFESFTFRGVGSDGTNHVDATYTYDALVALILANAI